MLEALVTTYWTAKTARIEMTRVLYRSLVELDKASLIESIARRIDAATATMLACASDATFVDLPTINLTLSITLSDMACNAFEHLLPDVENRAAPRRGNWF